MKHNLQASLVTLNSSIRDSFTLRPLDIYVAALAGMGVGVVGVSAFQLTRIPHAAGWLLFAGWALVARRFVFQVPGINPRLSLSEMFYVSSAVLFGPGPATVTIAVDSLVRSYGRGYPVQQVLFNGSAPAIAFWAGCQVFFHLLGAGPVFDSAVEPYRVLLPLAALGSVYYALNSGFTALAVGLETTTSPIDVWRARFAAAPLNFVGAASTAPAPTGVGAAEGPEMLMALANLARIIQDGPTPADVGSVAWNHIRHVVPGATCGFFMMDPDTDSVVARFVAGPGSQMLQGLHLKVGERLTGKVAETAQPILNADAALDLGNGAALGHVVRCFSVPLIHRDQLVGVLSLYGAAAFDEEQAKTIQLVAPSLAQMFAAVAAQNPVKAMRPTLVRFTA